MLFTQACFILVLEAGGCSDLCIASVPKTHHVSRRDSSLSPLCVYDLQLMLSWQSSQTLCFNSSPAEETGVLNMTYSSSPLRLDTNWTCVHVCVCTPLWVCLCTFLLIISPELISTSFSLCHPESKDKSCNSSAWSRKYGRWNGARRAHNSPREYSDSFHFPQDWLWVMANCRWKDRKTGK